MSQILKMQDSVLVSRLSILLVIPMIVGVNYVSLISTLILTNRERDLFLSYFPGKHYLSALPEGDASRRRGEVHHIQRQSWRIWELSDYNFKSSSHCHLRQAPWPDLLHDHVQIIHSDTGWTRVPAWKRLLFHFNFFKKWSVSANWRPVFVTQHEGRLQGRGESDGDDDDVVRKRQKRRRQHRSQRPSSRRSIRRQKVRLVQRRRREDGEQRLPELPLPDPWRHRHWLELCWAREAERGVRPAHQRGHQAGLHHDVIGCETSQQFYAHNNCDDLDVSFNKFKTYLDIKHFKCMNLSALMTSYLPMQFLNRNFVN